MKPKRVTSWRGPVTRHGARSKQLQPRKAAAVRPAGKTLSDLTGPRFEPHTRRSRHKHMTETRQTKYTYSFCISNIFTANNIASTSKISKLHTHILRARFGREKTDENCNHQCHQKKKSRVIHVMEILEEGWSFVLFTTYRLRVKKYHNKTGQTEQTAT